MTLHLMGGSWFASQTVPTPRNQ